MSQKEIPESGKDKKQEDYSFMKETIKKKPLNVSAYARRAVVIVLCGGLFGVSAAVAFTLTCPLAAEKFIAGEAVSLSDARPGPLETGTKKENESSSGKETDDGETEVLSDTEQDTEREDDAGQELTDSAQGSQTGGQGTSSNAASQGLTGSYMDGSGTGQSLDIYTAIYQDAVSIAEKSMKAMVRISGLSGDSDLLDDSFLTYGDEEGVVFFNNESDLYILTNYKGLEQSEVIHVTFSNGAAADGVLCKEDPRTGLAVVRVPLELLTDKEWKEIYVASLSDSFNLNNEKTVIAIGSPSGNFGSIMYGLVTSVSGRMTVADAEYSLLGTNIMGSSESSGVFLDMNGDVIGMVIRTPEDENILKGVSIAEIRPLIETLSNGEAIRYLGICGASVSKMQAANLGIPEGVYVDSVESDSPAMIAGIQNGDIITKLNDHALTDMDSYMTELQAQKVGDEAELTVYRKGAEGKFVEMKFDVTIEEK